MHHKHVDEVVANQQAWQGKRLQLHGHVVTNSILRKPNTLGKSSRCRTTARSSTRYTGIVPDTFKDTPGSEAEVVLKGHADAGRVSHRAERRDGESVLRACERNPKWPPSAASCSSRRSSSAATPAVVSVVGARRHARA